MKVFKCQLHWLPPPGSLPSISFLSTLGSLELGCTISPFLVLAALPSLSGHIMTCICITHETHVETDDGCVPRIQDSPQIHQNQESMICSACWKSNHFINIWPLAMFQKIIRTGLRKDLGKYQEEQFRDMRFSPRNTPLFGSVPVLSPTHLRLKINCIMLAPGCLSYTKWQEYGNNIKVQIVIQYL